MTTGEKITALRKDKGITQEQLSEMLEVSRQSVSRWEMDIAFPEISKLIKLSRLFSCSIDFLLNEDVEIDNIYNLTVSVYDGFRFIVDCGYFFLATSVKDRPDLRPMGWIYSDNKALYIATSKKKKVYSDIMSNPMVELASYNLNTRKWIRISGTAKVESSSVIQKEMMSMYPVLKQEFIDEKEIYLAIFKISVENMVID